MATTDCKNYREELKAYADGEVSPLQRVRLRAHLDGCPDCREELAFMEQMAADFKAVETVAEAKLSPELRAKVLSRLEGIRPEPRPLPFWKRRPLFVLGGFGATLATAAVFLFLFRPAMQSSGVSESDKSLSLAKSMPAAASAPVAAPELAYKADSADRRAETSVQDAASSFGRDSMATKGAGEPAPMQARAAGSSSSAGGGSIGGGTMGGTTAGNANKSLRAGNVAGTIAVGSATSKFGMASGAAANEIPQSAVANAPISAAAAPAPTRSKTLAPMKPSFAATKIARRMSPPASEAQPANETLTVVVDNPVAITDTAEAAVKAAGGTIKSTARTVGADGRPNVRLTVTVPEGQREAVTAAVQAFSIRPASADKFAARNAVAGKRLPADTAKKGRGETTLQILLIPR